MPKKTRKKAVVEEAPIVVEEGADSGVATTTYVVPEEVHPSLYEAAKPKKSALPVAPQFVGWTYTAEEIEAFRAKYNTFCREYQAVGGSVG